MSKKTKYRQLAVLVALIGLVGFSLFAQRATFSHSQGRAAINELSVGDETTSPARAPFADGGDFYLVRPDLRRCASPLCGGYWVKRVNYSSTRCANRRWMRECYVAEIDWSGQTEVEGGEVLLRGQIIARRYPRFGNLGALRVTESWKSAAKSSGSGTLYRVRDRGVRCITHPCLTHQAAKLNSQSVENIAGVDLAATGATGEQISEAAAAMTQPEGVIVAGNHAVVSGPAGRAQTLKATKFYLRAGAQIGGSPSGAKRCFKTGCSSQICADDNVVTTCEFRPEYACYQKAICERQKSGECGFTQTAELQSCLARAKRQP